MRISVFGLGYVGTVTAAYFASQGHTVIGVDVSAAKVGLFNSGTSPVLEPGLDELLTAAVAEGRLQGTTDAAAAVLDTEVSLITVGTPSRNDGSLDLQYVNHVVTDIARALRNKPSYHVVVVRSTMLPGSTERVVLPLLETHSDRRVGTDIGLVFNPEFLREGSALADFRRPSRTVIGRQDATAGRVVAELYEGIDSSVVQTELRLAEMIKYADNAFHALKISFANEIGALCAGQGIDAQELMQVFRQDTRLAVSAAYLRPGAAFGGSCLPKDLRALRHYADDVGVQIPVLEAVLASNAAHKRRSVEQVLATGKNRIAVLGLSFKPGTDDLRESPALDLVSDLQASGCRVTVHDRLVCPERLLGANLAYVEEVMPNLLTMFEPSLERAIQDAEVVVVSHDDPAFAAVGARLRPDQVLIDLAH